MTPVQRKLIALLNLGFCVALTGLAQEAKKFVIGDAAPPFTSEKLLQNHPQERLDWDGLRGKVVVLDFWATWCGPCVAAIPHWNELVTKFAGRPVVFVSITDEEEGHIRKFLEKRPIAGWHALALDRSMFDAYGVPARPHTVVVNAAGKIAAMTTPDHLTADVLEQVLAGKPAGISVRPMGVPNLDWDLEEIDWRDGILPEFQFILKPVQMAAGGQIYRPGSNRFAADGALLANLIQSAFETDFFHVDYRSPLPDQTYRVSVLVPRGREAALLPFMQSALTAMFGFTARWEMQDKDSYVLRGPGGGKPALQESRSGEETFYFMRSKIVGRKQPLAKLVGALTNFLGKPVVDETGLTALYDWDLGYEPGKPDVLIQDVRARLGLELVRGVRPVRMLVVEVAATTPKQATPSSAP